MKLETIWKWIISALAFVGAIAVFILLSKDDAQEKVDAIENEIDDIDKEIKKKEKERKRVLDDANHHGDIGDKIDKEIEIAKKKKRNLSEKRKQMKKIFSKYGE